MTETRKTQLQNCRLRTTYYILHAVIGYGWYSQAIRLQVYSVWLKYNDSAIVCPSYGINRLLLFCTITNVQNTFWMSFLSLSLPHSSFSSSFFLLWHFVSDARIGGKVFLTSIRFHWVCFGFFLRSLCFGYNKSRTFGMVLDSSDFIGYHWLNLSAHLFSCWSFNLLKRDGEQKHPRFIYYRALSVLFIVHSLNNTIELIECCQMLGTFLICKFICYILKRISHASFCNSIIFICNNWNRRTYFYRISRGAEKSNEF